MSSSLDTESLLTLLQDEVSRLRISERSHQEHLELAERDSKRTVVMLQLTHDQLQLLKEANVKLQRHASDSAALIEKLRHEVSVLTEETTHLQKCALDADALHKDQHARADAELALWKQRLSAQEKANEVLRNEMAENAQRHEACVSDGERQSRKAFETSTALEVRLKQKLVELQDLEVLREKERKETTAREYELSKTVSEQKRALAAAAEANDRQRRADFTVITTLKAECEDYKSRFLHLQKTLDAERKETFETIERLKIELSMARERHDEAESSFRAREKVLEMQVAKFCTDLKSAQLEINSLADREVLQLKSNSEALILLHARHDVSKLRVEELESELHAAKEKLRSEIVSHAAELDKVKADHTTVLRQQQDLTSSKSQELQHMSMDLRVAQSRIRSLEDELQQHQERTAKLIAAQAADIAALRTELDGYRSSVKKLEDHIENNYEMRILSEQNQRFEEDARHLKEKLRHANQTLANLRVEADISESYRLKMLQEQFEAEMSRVTALEKERRSARTLLTALIAAAKKGDGVDLSLASEVDQFYRVFGAHPHAD